MKREPGPCQERGEGRKFFLFFFFFEQMQRLKKGSLLIGITEGSWDTGGCEFMVKPLV